MVQPWGAASSFTSEDPPCCPQPRSRPAKHPRRRTPTSAAAESPHHPFFCHRSCLPVVPFLSHLQIRSRQMVATGPFWVLLLISLVFICYMIYLSEGTKIILVCPWISPWLSWEVLGCFSDRYYQRRVQTYMAIRCNGQWEFAMDLDSGLHIEFELEWQELTYNSHVPLDKAMGFMGGVWLLCVHSYMVCKCDQPF